MKIIAPVLFAFLFLFLTTVYSQSPEAFNYQAVLRNSGGQVMSSQSIDLKVQILDAVIGGSILYSESHSVTTSPLGLINIAVGQGSNSSTAFDSLSWGSSAQFIEILIDSSGQGNYISMGTTQLLSVPYALYAKVSGNGGAQGATGPSGNDGTGGTAGSQGATGPSGNDGSAGTAGSQGVTGPSGNDGSAGTAGSQGATGPSGNDGSAGTAGSQGATGPSGNDGTAGTVGSQGATGPSGNNGSAGTAGSQGATGPSGNDGSAGTAGSQGATGPSGNDGTVGTVGSQGATGPSGNDGTNGTDGSQGATGADGAQGPTGPTDPLVYNDTSATNELQQLSVSTTGDTLYLQNGGFVIIPGISAANTTGGTYPAGTVHCNGTPTAIVDVTNPTTGEIWMDRNLGATQAATSSTDVDSYGDLYQWGRFSDGHQCRTSNTTATLSSVDQPAHGDFILEPNSPYDWRSPQDDNLWQGVNAINNPCPSGYRLPTEAELEAERLSWSNNNSAGAIASPLRLPAAGSRGNTNWSGCPACGWLFDVGTSCFYWSSTLSGEIQPNTHGSRYLSTVSSMMGSQNGYATMYDYNRAYGNSVRCIKD
jgi:uncharacterized protein (TIGR02145 family)